MSPSPDLNRKNLKICFVKTRKRCADDSFDVDAELAKPTFSKAGDLWLLGDHRLVCGDSTKPETYEILMNGKKANLVVTDPPYNVNYEGSAGKIKNDNMENDAFYQFLLDAYTRMYESMADDASIYVFHADTEGLNFRRAFADAGFYLSGCCIWKSSHSSLDAALTSGCMSLASSVGRNPVSISGIPDEKKRPSGNLINQKEW